MTSLFSASDDDGGSSSAQQSVSVQNLAPSIASFTVNGPIYQGDAATLTVVASDAAGANDPLLYEFDCYNSGSFSQGSSDGTATCYFFGSGSYQVAVQVSDGDGGLSTSSIELSVNNSAPVIDALHVSATNEGSFATISVVASDAGQDTLDYAFDCNNDGSYEIDQEGANEATCYFGASRAEPYSVPVRVSDGSDVALAVAAVTVSNVTPTVNAGGGTTTVTEGSPFASSGSFTDPGADNWSATVNYGDGGGDQPLTLDANKTFTFAHTYDAGTYTIRLCVTDSDGAKGCAERLVQSNSYDGDSVGYSVDNCPLVA